MILYFTGTGNSEYVAKRIAKQLDDTVMNLFEKIKKKDYSDLSSHKPWVIVTPTYAWRIPRILYEWIEQTNLTGTKKIYFVMTCGGNNGNSDKYLKKLCELKKMEYFGCYSIVMPENYVALFPTPTHKEALEIIEKAEVEIDKVIKWMSQEVAFEQPKISIKDNINSGIVNNLFYPLFVHDKKFYATELCISCGKCAQVCPLENIQLKKGKPSWQNKCTHCMACINQCPKEAIEYGKNTKGKIRYLCPK